MSVCQKCGHDLVNCCPDCGKPVETYSRIVGYMRPISNWNPGKVAEFNDRTEFVIGKLTEHQKSE